MEKVERVNRLAEALNRGVKSQVEYQKWINKYYPAYTDTDEYQKDLKSIADQEVKMIQPPVPTTAEVVSADQLAQLEKPVPKLYIGDSKKVNQEGLLQSSNMQYQLYNNIEVLPPKQATTESDVKLVPDKIPDPMISGQTLSPEEENLSIFLKSITNDARFARGDQQKIFKYRPEKWELVPSEWSTHVQIF
jgi:hypothetical protein